MDFNAKMHQIQFWPGLWPRPLLGELIASTTHDLPAGFKRPISKGRGQGRDEIGGHRRNGMVGRGISGFSLSRPANPRHLRMDVHLEFYGILSMHIAAISCLKIANTNCAGNVVQAPPVINRTRYSV